MIIQNEKLIVRNLEAEDKYLLVKWLSNPEVLQYYEGRDNPFDLEKVEKSFYSITDSEVRCIIQYENVDIGYIQFYQLDEDSRTLYGYGESTEIIYGMDQFVGEVNYWNKGIGTQLINLMVNFLVEQKKADKIAMDPQTWNVRAISCYEKCGFRKVKLLSKNELHEGEYRDCWLIEYSK